MKAKYLFVIINIFLAILIMPSFLKAATYYVDATAGNDSRTKEQAANPATPWKTIAKINALTPTFLPAGSTVYLKCGETWREQLTVPTSGYAGSPIIFGSYGTGAKPIISGADVTAPETAKRLYGIDTNSNNYITIDGLRLQNTVEWGGGVCINGSQNVTVNNCDLVYNYYGILCRGSNYGYLTLSNNTISNNLRTGIQQHYYSQCLGGANNGATCTQAGDCPSGTCDVHSSVGYSIITGNIVFNNGTGDFEAYGIDNQGNNTEISHNTIFQNGNGGISLGIPSHNHGIYSASKATEGIDIYDNVIWGQEQGSGIKICGSGNVYNNRIYDNGYNGISCGWNGTRATVQNIYGNIIYGNYHGLWETGSESGLTLNIFNNTFVDNNNCSRCDCSSDGTCFTYTGPKIDNSVAVLNIKNNIIIDTKTVAWHRLFQTATQSGKTSVDNNCFWFSGTDGTWHMLTYNKKTNNPKNITEWAVYKTATPWDESHTIVADPKLKDPANGKFWCLPESPCINAGDSTLGSPYNYGLDVKSSWPSAVITRLRSGAWDMGAYENEDMNAPANLKVIPAQK